MAREGRVLGIGGLPVRLQKDGCLGKSGDLAVTEGGLREAY